jgi:hypothetical protein
MRLKVENRINKQINILIEQKKSGAYLNEIDTYIIRNCFIFNHKRSLNRRCLNPIIFI